MIPRNDCKHGHTYRINSRNLMVGVFNSEDGSFMGIREKFGHYYLFPEYHRDNGPPYGTVAPVRELEKCPIEDIRDSLGTICHKCGVPVDWKPDDPKAEPGVRTGKWHHLAETSCTDVSPSGVSNKALYGYLEKIECRIDLEEFIEELPTTNPNEPSYFRWHLLRAQRLIGIDEKSVAVQFGVTEETVKLWFDGSAHKGNPAPDVRKAVYDWILLEAKKKQENS